MKIIKYKFYLIAFLFVGFLSSCADELTELNVDQKSPQTVGASTLISNAQVGLFDFMSTPNVNQNTLRLWSQHWTGAVYTDESNYEINQRDINGNTWNRMYATVLTDLKEADRIVSESNLSEEQKTNQAAIIEVLQVYTYHLLVDFFGDVPYSEALQGDNVTPTYDDDEAIYTDLFSRLDVAIADLSGESGLGEADLVYGGNTSAWKKMANSLKLRLAIRVADVNPSMAQSAAEEAFSSGVFTSNADNFSVTYLAGPPNTNPLWEDLIQSGRRDFVAAKPLGDVMNELDDPRRDKYFKNLGEDGNVIGGDFGFENAYGQHSNPGLMQEDPTFPGVLLSYSEVEFLLADAAARGFSVGGTPAEHYENGIEASMDFWGVSESMQSAYLADPDVAWDSAEGDWKFKIGLQKWISLYDNGFETWTATRMYDSLEEVLTVAPLAETYPPNRYTYPVSEYDLNTENVEAAASAIGNDLPSTRVFWDAEA